MSLSLKRSLGGLLLGAAVLLPGFTMGQAATAPKTPVAAVAPPASSTGSSTGSSQSLACAEVRTTVNGQEYVTQECTTSTGLTCLVVVGPSGVSQSCYATN